MVPEPIKRLLPHVEGFSAAERRHWHLPRLCLALLVLLFIFLRHLFPTLIVNSRRGLRVWSC